MCVNFITASVIIVASLTGGFANEYDENRESFHFFVTINDRVVVTYGPIHEHMIVAPSTEGWRLLKYV